MWADACCLPAIDPRNVPLIQVNVYLADLFVLVALHKEMIVGTTEQNNKEIVRRFNKECIEDGNQQSLNQLVHPSFINYTAPPGMDKTREAAWQTIQVLRNSLTGLKVDLLMQVAENDLVTTYKVLSGLHSAEFMGVPATNKMVSLYIIDIIRLEDGKYMEHWSIRDIYSLLNQLK